MKRLLYFITGFIIIIIILWALRFQILRGAGNYLIYEDGLQRADIIFVLGGDALSRAEKAAGLYKKGFSGKVVCTGEPVPVNLKTLNIIMTESELTRNYLIRCGVDSLDIEEFKKCSSTMDEGYFFLEYSKKNRIKSAIIVTGKFHTRRVNRVFRDMFEREGINIMISGAPSAEFNEDEWWKTEDGLIALNNEYMKSFYYFIKY